MGDDEVQQHACEQSVLDFVRMPFDSHRHIEAVAGRNNWIEQLRERPIRADAPTVQPSPQDGRDQRKHREEIPAQVVSKDRQIAADEAKDVDDRQQLALVNPRYTTATTSVRYFNDTLLRKNS